MMNLAEASAEKPTFLTTPALTTPDGRPELSGYEAEPGTEDNPIRFFKNAEGRRIVRILQPGKEAGILVPLPEKPDSPELLKMITAWEDIQHIVMLDQETLVKLGELAKAYNARQPLILEGPPGVSKTFLIWIFSCIIETPYARVPFSSSSRESTVLGGMAPGHEVRFKRPLSEILKSHVVTTAKKLLEEKKAASERSGGEKLLFKEEILLSSLIYLEKELSSGTDQSELLTEVDFVQNELGIEILVEHNDVWEDPEFITVAEGGGIGALDENNTAKDRGVMAALHPFAEAHTKKIAMSPMRPGGDIPIHEDFWMVSAVNGLEVTGTHAFSSAFKSRNALIKLGGVTEDYIANILKFMTYGEDPKVVINGKDIPGRKDVKTDYRFLEDVPLIDSLIGAVAKIHIDLSKKSIDKVIGQDIRAGGKYVYDQRSIISLLNAVKQVMDYEQFHEKNNELDEKDFNDLNWVYIFKEALRQTYLSGMTDEDGDGDRTLAEKIINDHPVWTALERKQSNVPAYVAGGVGGKVGANGEFTPEW